MGFLDALLGRTRCPDCGSKGARKSEGRIRCPNPSCQFFDATLRRPRGRSRIGGIYSPQTPLVIRYRNFQDREKSFTADRETIRRKRNHIIARVAPMGENISLSRERIQNLQEVEQALPEPVESARAGPTARERQVLAFHKKHSSTSPLYEQIRAKYPDW